MMSQQLPELAIIFPRHVRNPNHKDLWKECLKCARTHYKDVPIVIIDDNSIPDLIEPLCEDQQWMMHNVTVVNTDFIGAGEMLPYYYFYKLRPARKAIIISDSMFIQKPFDDSLINNIVDIKFLWSFEYYCLPDCYKTHLEFYYKQIHLLSNLKEGAGISDLYASQKWVGCFGSASIITLDFLDKLEQKYNFVQIVKHIHNRDMRQLLERVVGLVAIYEKQEWSRADISIFGDIFTYPNAFNNTYADYKNNQVDPKLYIAKCWNSR
jgi:hypothetical protein